MLNKDVILIILSYLSIDELCEYSNGIDTINKLFPTLVQKNTYIITIMELINNCINIYKLCKICKTKKDCIHYKNSIYCHRCLYNLCDICDVSSKRLYYIFIDNDYYRYCKVCLLREICKKCFNIEEYCTCRRYNNLIYNFNDEMLENFEKTLDNKTFDKELLEYCIEGFIDKIE
jgi:hypothetical protein